MFYDVFVSFPILYVFVSQDNDTLMEELDSFQTQNIKTQPKNNPEKEYCVDFVAITTVIPGVPSTSRSKVMSFDDSSYFVSK